MCVCVQSCVYVCMCVWITIFRVSGCVIMCIIILYTDECVCVCACVTVCETRPPRSLTNVRIERLLKIEKKRRLRTRRSRNALLKCYTLLDV